MDPLTVFKQYGVTPLAYSTLQPKAQHFWYKRDGYIAYFTHYFLGKRYISVLGDPIADPQLWPELIAQFIHHYPHACFYNISTGCNSILSQNHFNGHAVGWDVYWDPFQPIPSKRALKRCRRLQKKHSILLSESPISSSDYSWMNNITQQWLSTRHISHELNTFFSRPLQPAVDTLCRYVVARDHSQQPIGFMVLDPLYRSGSCIGYVVNHLRYLPQYPFLSRLFLQFSAHQIISLGPVTCSSSSLFFRFNYCYSFQGLNQFRTYYPHFKSKLYSAYRSTIYWHHWLALYCSFFKRQSLIII